MSLKHKQQKQNYNKKDNYNMKIVELKINDSMIAGFEATALVENPAIELDFVKFGKEENGQDVYLISCSSEKKDMKCAAAELYDSALFKKSLSFSRKHQPDDNYIKILSAKYYLTGLNQVIEPYDLTLKNFSTQQKKDWANRVYSQMLDLYSLQYDRFMFLAGDAYTKYLMGKFRYKTDVLEGMRIGERMSYLDKFYVVTNNDKYAAKHNFSLNENMLDELSEEEVLEMILGGLIEEELSINTSGLPNYVNEASTGKKRNFAAELKEKQMLVGPLMTPNKLIPRVDEKTGEEYEVFFSKDTIKQISYKMMQDGLLKNVNIEHDPNQPVDDVYLVETWLVEDAEHDKSTLYGFNPVVGQWYGMYKVNNKPVWDEYIKTGKVKGFSVEGYFTNNVLTLK